ncbi:MAG: zinc ribbon domain-containing protein [Oscillospiraceae bacterium]|nr:zinc ribbon domain-containing protein [Oscillospiraceae bacterium]
MLCPDCGRMIPEGSEICPNCGRSVDHELAQENASAEPENDLDTRLEAAEHLPVSVVPEGGTAHEPAPGDQVKPIGERISTDPRVPDRQSGYRKTLVAIIAAMVFIIGGVFVYRNLPESRFKRYMKKAREAYQIGNYSSASESYYKALDIHPDSEEALMNIDDMYAIVKERAQAASSEGRFVDSVREARILADIKPEALEENKDVLEASYKAWAMYLVEQGTEREVEELIAVASSELPAESTDRIRAETQTAYHLRDLYERLSVIAERIRTANPDTEYAAVFSSLEEAYPVLTEYRENGGMIPVRVLDGDGTAGVEFNIDGKNNAQVYIGEFVSERIKEGHARTFFISGAGTANRSYEFFETDWTANDPRGAFRETDYGNGPENPPTAVLSGTLYDGHYNGDIRHTRGDLTYNMKFSYGKVEVLDTVDPNGNRNNVVGYTDDRDNWLVFSDSALTSKYGVRYLS